MSNIHRRPSSAGPLVKVIFELPEDDWHGYSRETMWAETLSQGKYRLRNVPLAVYGYSYDDVVNAAECDQDLIVAGPIMRGGHSTFGSSGSSVGEFRVGEGSGSRADATFSGG